MNAHAPPAPSIYGQTPAPPTEAELDDVRGILRALGHVRQAVISLGAMGATACLSSDADHRAEAIAQIEHTLVYAAAMRRMLDGRLRERLPDMEPEVRDLLTLMDALGDGPDGDVWDEAAARRLVELTSVRIAKGLQNVISALISRETQRQAEEQLRIDARAATVLRMCDEMEGIGRTIHLISLNAAVEAARAGGASGRVFGTIAQEVRTLAGRAAKVIASTRSQVRDDPD